MRRALGILAILAMAGGGYGYWLHRTGEAAIPAAPVRATPVVKTARAAVHCLPGLCPRHRPGRSVQRSRAEDPGRRPDRSCAVHRGPTGRKRPALVEIDPRPYQAAVAQAEGQLARDQAQLQAAKADLGRSTALVEKGFATHQSYDQQTSLVGQFTAAIKTDQAMLDNAGSI
ncbi:MAG: hypothetical protein WDN69_08180 [Aliidongia sp.]